MSSAPDWTEIVGEMTRGGTPASNSLTPVLGDGSPYDVLGAAAAMLQQSPAFAQYAAKRAAATRPITHQIPLQRAREWHINFGPVSGTASTATTITVQPQCLFRGEKLIATDDGGSKAAGFNSRIQSVFIGQKIQSPANQGGGALTVMFANGALGNGIQWDTCEKALSISMAISFITTCTFEATVFGKAVL